MTKHSAERLAGASPSNLSFNRSHERKQIDRSSRNNTNYDAHYKI